MLKITGLMLLLVTTSIMLLPLAEAVPFLSENFIHQHSDNNAVDAAGGSGSTLFRCIFDPPTTLPALNDTSEITISINCTCLDSKYDNATLRTRILVEDASIAEPISETLDAVYVDEADRFIMPPNLKTVICQDKHFSTEFRLRGKFLGHTRAYFTIIADESDQQLATFPYSIAVQRRERPIDTIFVIVVALLVALNTINMGMQIDLEVVKRTIRQPLAPAIGMACQFIFMPICAFIIGKLVLRHPYYQLGLFTLGCAPGGGASNFWTYLFAGDLDLSVTMTFISTLGALAVMPFWLYTVGRTFGGTASITIPFRNLFTYLIALVVPIAIGVLIRRKFPSFTDKSRWLIRPLTAGLLLFIFTFGIYANIYMFYIMTWQVLLSGLLVSWLGYAAGALAALAARQNVQQIIAISIETGVQNTGIAIIILRLSLPQPDGDLASVVPVTGSIMVFIPLFLCWCKKTLREKCASRRNNSGVEGKQGERTRHAAEELVQHGIIVEGDDDAATTNGVTAEQLIVRSQGNNTRHVYLPVPTSTQQQQHRLISEKDRNNTMIESLADSAEMTSYEGGGDAESISNNNKTTPNGV